MICWNLTKNVRATPVCVTLRWNKERMKEMNSNSFNIIHSRVNPQRQTGDTRITSHIATSDIQYRMKTNACFTHSPFAVRMQSMCRMRCRSSMDSLCFHTGRICSPLLTRGCLPQTQHLSIILISNPNVVSLY